MAGATMRCSVPVYACGAHTRMRLTGAAAACQQRAGLYKRQTDGKPTYPAIGTDAPAAISPHLTSPRQRKKSSWLLLFALEEF